MAALSAPIQHVEPGETLVLVVALPLLAALANGLAGQRMERRAGGLGKWIGAAGAGTALAFLLHAATVLAALPPENRVLFDAPWSLARIGSLHASLTLSLDPLALVFAALLSVFALGAHLTPPALRDADAIAEDAGPAHHARVSLLLGGALLALLADSVPAFGAGVAAASVATASLADDGSAYGSAQVGSILVLAGAVVLFWALGGSWGIALGNEPTYTRRNPIAAGATAELDVDDEAAVGPSIYPVIVGARPLDGKPIDPMAKGTVSLAAWPGARVFLRGASTPSGVSPFLGHVVNAGRFDVEIERAGKRVLLRAIEVPGNAETAFVPVGPTLSLREVRDQITLVDATHQRFVRTLLDPLAPGHRRCFGVSATSIATVLFALGAIAIAMSGRSAARATSALTTAALPLIAAGFLARAAFLFALSPVACTTLAAIASAIALAAAGLASLATETRRALGLVIAAQLGLALVGFGAQATASGAVLLLVAMLSGVAAHAALEVLEERALRVALVALVGAPLPLGVAFARDVALGRTFSSDVVAYPKAVWAVAVAAVFLSSYAAFRLLSARLVVEEDPQIGRIATIVAVFAALVGPVLGWSGEVFGAGVGGARTYAESLLAPSFDVAAVLGDRATHAGDPGKTLAFAISSVALAAAIAGWHRGRRTIFEQPARLSAAIAPAAGTIGSSLQALAATIAWIDDRVLAAPSRALAAVLVRGRRDAERRP